MKNLYVWLRDVLGVGAGFSMPEQGVQYQAWLNDHDAHVDDFIASARDGNEAAKGRGYAAWE